MRGRNVRPAKRAFTIGISALVAGACFASLASAAGPGALDPSFAGGVATTSIAPAAGDDFQNGLVVEPDDSVIVAGSSDMGSGVGWDVRLTRYTKHGALDGSFGDGGTALVSTAPPALSGFFDGIPSEHIWQIARQPDGKIVAAGRTNGGELGGGLNALIARFLPDGTLDWTFGDQGIVRATLAPEDRPDEAQGVAVQADGKIVIAGWAQLGATRASRNLAVARFTGDGRPDPAFGDQGRVLVETSPTGEQDYAHRVGVRPDGRIVVVGHARTGTLGADPSLPLRQYTLARLHPDGALDVTFGGDGIVNTLLTPAGSCGADALALLADGSTVVGGFLNGGQTGADAAIVRYRSDGTLDESFGGGDGFVALAVGPGDAFDAIFDLAVDDRGGIVAAGWAGDDSLVVRLRPDGDVDEGFGDHGRAVLDLAQNGGYDAFYDVEIDKTGKVVAAGECERGAGVDICVARLKRGGET